MKNHDSFSKFKLAVL